METVNVKKRLFISPEELLREIPVEPRMTVADFGCGNGHYSVAAGVMIGPKGQVFSIDIVEDRLSQTLTMARMVGLRNLSTRQCDLEKLGACPLADSSCDLVIIASLFHDVKERDNIVREAYRILRTGGKVLVVEWKPESQFGPVPAVRIPEAEMRKFLEKFSLRPVRSLDAGSFHYALLYEK